MLRNVVCSSALPIPQVYYDDSHFHIGIIYVSRIVLYVHIYTGRANQRSQGFRVIELVLEMATSDVREM